MAVINGFIKVEWDFHLSLTRVFAQITRCKYWAT